MKPLLQVSGLLKFNFVFPLLSLVGKEPSDREAAAIGELSSANARLRQLSWTHQFFLYLEKWKQKETEPEFSAILHVLWM